MKSVSRRAGAANPSIEHPAGVGGTRSMDRASANSVVPQLGELFTSYLMISLQLCRAFGKFALLPHGFCHYALPQAA